MTYLYENFTFDFEHSSIKCKIHGFKCHANKLYSLSKNNRGKIFTHTRIFKGKAEIIRKGMHFHNTVTHATTRTVIYPLVSQEAQFTWTLSSLLQSLEERIGGAVSLYVKDGGLGGNWNFKLSLDFEFNTLLL